jgi:membrane associated rhomboid family serine protease
MYTRPDSFPPIIKNLIFINALFFLATSVLFRDAAYLEGYEQYGLEAVFALWPITSDYFKPFQFFTTMFTHGSIGHLFFNMLTLWMFGRMLETVWGSKKFLTFYLICGVVASIVHIVVQYIATRYFGQPGSFVVGASGAVMGVMAAFAYLFPNSQVVSFPIMIPIKAKWLVLILVAFDLFGGLGGSGGGIAHFAHLGGAAAGLVIVYIWNKTNKRTFY